MSNTFVIYNMLLELFWSNEIGWVSLPDATLFDAQDVWFLSLPFQGYWVQYTLASLLPQRAVD